MKNYFKDVAFKDIGGKLEVKWIEGIQYIVVDLFAGAGGTTTGFELAELHKTDRERLGLPESFRIAKVVAAINHDPIAIKSHWVNHPEIQHFEEDITTLYGSIKAGILLRSPEFMRLVRLVDLYRAFYPDAKVVLWASLECTNFSKAKGGMARDADSRTLADHLHPYIIALNPDYIKIENVVEFMSWGPMIPKTGKTKEGYPFCVVRIWKDKKTKELRVGPHLVPESKTKGRDWIRWRKSICALGYYDEWKELNSADFGALTSRNRLFGCFAKHDLPIIWPEATHTKNPEKSPLFNQLKKWQPVKHALDFEDEGKTVFNREKPLSTKTMQRLFMGCVKHIAGGKTAFMAKAYRGNPDHQSKSLDEPAGTLTTIPNQQNLVFITKWNSNDKKHGGHPGHSVEDPCPVVSTQNRLGAAFIVKGFSANSGKSVNAGSSIDDPAPTLTTQNRERVAFISRYNGVNGGKHDNSHSVEKPVGALGCGDNMAKVSAQFIHLYYSSGGESSSIEDPANTIPTKARMSKVQADFFLDKQYSSGDSNNQSVEQPIGSILPVDKHKLVKAEKFIMDTSYNNIGQSIEQPAGTITADRHYHYIVNPSWGQGHSTGVDQPCPVVIARQDKAPLYLIVCKEGPVAVPVYEGDCEWTVKLKEFMALYGISDIKMRMLKVPELKKIQGFPDNYVLLGNQTDQKKFIGNAVHPYVPEQWIKAFYFRTLKIAA